MHAYVPPMENVTVWHLRDLARGERKRILAKDIEHISIPQFEGLTVEKMLDYANMFPQVMKAFPSNRKEIEKFPRQYIANVIHTVVGQPFQQWVDMQLESRNAELAEKKEMYIELDPQIEAVFKASTAVSGK